MFRLRLLVLWFTTVLYFSKRSRWFKNGIIRCKYLTLSVWQNIHDISNLHWSSIGLCRILLVRHQTTVSSENSAYRFCMELILQNTLEPNTFYCMNMWPNTSITWKIFYRVCLSSEKLLRNACLHRFPNLSSGDGRIKMSCLFKVLKMVPNVLSVLVDYLDDNLDEAYSGLKSEEISEDEKLAVDEHSLKIQFLAHLPCQLPGKTIPHSRMCFNCRQTLKISALHGLPKPQAVGAGFRSRRQKILFFACGWSVATLGAVHSRAVLQTRRYGNACAPMSSDLCLYRMSDNAWYGTCRLLDTLKPYVQIQLIKHCN